MEYFRLLSSVFRLRFKDIRIFYPVNDVILLILTKSSAGNPIRSNIP